MRAIQIHEFGGYEQLTFHDISVPKICHEEVLVKICASSVNPIDWKIRSGAVQARLPVQLPFTLGCDFSGIIEKVGEHVSRFKPGDEVYGYCAADCGGAHADYIALSANDIALRPKSLSLIESAAVPLGALTAYIPLFEDAGLSSGQRVLIHAAAGGVGSMAVQLAKHAGAQVFATGSASSGELIESLGADVVIDYNNEKFENIATQVDVVFDAVGGDTQIRSLDCLRANGYLAAIVNPPDLEVLAQRNLRGKRCAARPDGRILTEVAAMIDAGKVRPIVAEVMPLDKLSEAHKLSETGHVHGKIILRHE